MQNNCTFVYVSPDQKGGGVTHCHNVFTEEASERTGAIADGEAGAIGFVGTGSTVVILVV